MVSRGMAGRGGGEGEPDDGAAAVARADPDRAVVAFDDIADDREAEPRARKGPRLRRAVEALEHQRLLSVDDARPSIEHLDGAVRHPDVDRAAARIELAGIVEQVRDRPLDGAELPVDRRLVGVDPHLPAAPTFVPTRQLTRDVTERERFERVVVEPTAGDGDDLLDEHGRAPRSRRAGRRPPGGVDPAEGPGSGATRRGWCAGW